MATAKSRGEKWAEYRPSKAAWFWSCVGAAVLTGVVGFTWGGWVTGGTADLMAQQARYELAATVCVDRFMKEADAGVQLAALQKESSWKRDDFVADGGWARMPDVDQVPREVRDMCAERLADMELPVDDAAKAEAATSIQ
jgi:hypothetical protein